MQTPYERYLRIVTWARKRYTIDGVLIVNIGSQASPYTLIENLAAVQILGLRSTI